MLLFILALGFLAVLSASLFLWGYHEGKSAGIRQYRKECSECALSHGRQQHD
ncbi:hypothetical protein Metlim_1248 [Methanoplanus limicola DSM 2279]|uniref:Uncharacterized protein n=1 Tax=Methanoplanus limicola DSM 2279 TaxID=937775 RepID=H1Z190_9EURY|nr:hypothetical protein Metlim_1248 [Methanoplanus limicola DSM 2279]